MSPWSIPERHRCLSLLLRTLVRRKEHDFLGFVELGVPPSRFLAAGEAPVGIHGWVEWLGVGAVGVAGRALRFGAFRCVLVDSWSFSPFGLPPPGRLVPELGSVRCGL